MSVNCHVNQNWGIPTPKWAIYIRLFEFGLSNGGYKRMLCLVSVLWKKLPHQWIDTLEMILFPFKKQIRLRMGKFNYLISWFLIPDFSCPETWSHCLHKGRFIWEYGTKTILKYFSLRETTNSEGFFIARNQDIFSGIFWMNQLTISSVSAYL